MQSDWEIFNERYDAAPYAVQDFLDSDELAKFLHELQPRLMAHTEELGRVLALAADRILNIVDEKTFVQELGFSIDDTQKILAKIAPVLWDGHASAAQETLQAMTPVAPVARPMTSVPQVPAIEPQWGTAGERGLVSPAPAQAAPAPVPMGDVPDADDSLRDALALKPRTVEKIVERTVPTPNSKPLTREELLHALAAKRTLQSDIATIPPEK
jgi:hypothetical protein